METQPGEEETRDRPGPDSADPPLKRIAHYVLERELGRGAQGVVFLARDEILNRLVALKVLSGAGLESAAVRDRFVREAEVASRLDHPGICGVHEFGEENGVPFIAMQYVRGTTLADLLKAAQVGSNVETRSDSGDDGFETVTYAGTTMTMTARDGRVATHDVLRVIERAARALHAAHEAGLVHRDVKPGNVMITPDGDPVWLDFGLARDVDSDAQGLTQTGQIMGTPAYLAPEQIIGERGGIDRRTDVYALGVMLFECLTLQRPFEAESWNQLFHKILHAEPPDPRKLNPRVPRDLRTVVEVAMDRDPTRRYESAAELADDLHRVRSFEPIHAKAAGPALRMAKWSRRHPAKTVAMVAAVAFVVLGVTFVTVQAAAQRRAFETHLENAQTLLAEARFDDALEAVAQARERDAGSAAAVELKTRIERAREEAETGARRAADLQAAADARRESAELEREWRTTRERLVALDGRIAEASGRVFGDFATDAERGACAALELERERLELRAANLRRSAEHALERAARLEAPWDGPTDATSAAFAAFYMRRWHEAVQRGAAIEAAELKGLVESHDERGEYTSDFLGRGTLTVTGLPDGADLHLFRYHSCEELNGDGQVPRLVPVPTSGIGLAIDELSDGVRPGDRCLVVDEVGEDSLAARAGIRPHDLIVRIDGAPSGGGVFLGAPPLAPELAAAGVSPTARVVSINGMPIDHAYDWTIAPPPAEGEGDRLRVEGTDADIEIDRTSVVVVRAQSMARGAVGRPVRLTVWSSAGRIVELEVPADTPSGLECSETAYPLILSPANRIAAADRLEVDPGSYLLLARGEGCHPQRIHAVIPRHESVEAAVRLRPKGTIPQGFVCVPSGPFVFAGDPDAIVPQPARNVELPEFLIARHELTNREWFEFVNSPDILARIHAKERRIYLPRDVDGKELYSAREDGSGFDWFGYKVPAGAAILGDTPVLGISWNDVRDYLEWRNAKAAAAGEPWRYDLPTGEEWEKAARGVDGRFFPWGNRFDLSLMVNRHRRPDWLLDAPAGFEPHDESPFGLQDVAGSREEWTRDSTQDGENAIYVKRGGHWGSAVPGVFRLAHGTAAGAARFASTQGVRLVARPAH